MDPPQPPAIYLLNDTSAVHAGSRAVMAALDLFLAGVPFVAVGANSHKIEGLIAWSGPPIPVCRRRADLPAAMGFARGHRGVFLESHRFLLTQPVLDAAQLWNDLQPS